MSVGMSKRVYKEMVKEMNIIASQEDASQQQRASEVCDHSFIFLCTCTNLFIILNTNFQLFCCRKENKMEPNQHIRQDDKEKKG
jgi:hypothetical protein